MQDRSRVINVEISDKAKVVYDKQPHKGEFVSQAIVDYDSKGTVTRAEFEELKSRVERMDK